MNLKVFALRILVLATAFSNSVALVNFTSSRLYDEYDFATQAVNVSKYCDSGCLIYVSVPEASAKVAKKIIVRDFSQADKSLYEISQMKNGLKKGYFQVQRRNELVTFFNLNPGYTTAPIALWIVNGDAANYGENQVYEAASLRILISQSSLIDVVTVISAEPFTLRTTTEGPMKMISTLTGFDAVNPDTEDDCFDVFSQMNETTYVDMQVAVHSPMISIYFDGLDYKDSSVSIAADVGNHLDFTGLSFAATPGFIGCKENEMFRSTLYDSISSYKYQISDWLYDVVVTPVMLNTGANHPVTITDNTNNRKITWSGAEPVDANTFAATNNLEFSWAEDDQNPDQLVFIQVKPRKSSTEEVCLGFGDASCYLIGKVSGSFEEAVKFCENLAATVASVHSAQEDSFIRRLAVSSGQVNGLYLGATLNVNVFQWMDGSEWNYINFYPGYPQYGEGNCLALDTSSAFGQWMNVPCSSNLPVACERK